MTRPFPEGLTLSKWPGEDDHYPRGFPLIRGEEPLPLPELEDLEGRQIVVSNMACAVVGCPSRAYIEGGVWKKERIHLRRWGWTEYGGRWVCGKHHEHD